ncbi:metallophosphoesterase family protein [Rummeliibacillus sp. NPDC094406]|uniref:metallophosphoesterase family protein n=1 Tax=Rummeliibacillus sp. NPDC094406 TaxID=3364511 RepID=UPI00380FDC5B
MQYALLGDLHSSVSDTKAVLADINANAENAAIIGLGDLYECKIGKKRAKEIVGITLDEAAELSDEFTRLLQFPSVRGNQEERIMNVTGLDTFLTLPESLEIEGAEIIHGHQFKWSSDWKPFLEQIEAPIVFFGHSHDAALYRKGHKKEFQYGQPIHLKKKKYGVNVGSVIENREWCLYDSDERTVTFMKVQS